MFGKHRKIKKEYDEQLFTLIMETKKDWEQAKEIEKYLNDYDQDVIARRKITESKYFYLFKEAKGRRLGSD
ncbi:YaaL family protein [Sporosarcina sp. FA9]|uniref:YaaL family protein n=1 Tax=Sporosarcina sp. FA9 TaxID=3413030 RepID=UPI003F6553CD